MILKTFQLQKTVVVSPIQPSCFKKGITMLSKKVNEVEIEKKRKVVCFIRERFVWIKYQTIYIQNGKLIRKKIKIYVLLRYDFKLISYFTLHFDNRVVTQKLDPSYYIKSDGSIYPFREQKKAKTSRGIPSMKSVIGYVGKIQQYVTFT